LYKALVEAKFVYGLSTAWFCKAARARLDGFQNRCLRRIFSIQPSFISRVPNAEVLAVAQQPKLSTILLRRQRLLFGKIARLPVGHPMRSSTFTGASLTPAVEQYVRRVGRPKDNWTRKLLNEALAICASYENL
jgi:hypothetical protein